MSDVWYKTNYFKNAYKVFKIEFSKTHLKVSADKPNIDFQLCAFFRDFWVTQKYNTCLNDSTVSLCYALISKNIFVSF